MKNLAKPVDIIVGTPGRILHLMNDGNIKLDQIQSFVLDEADQMLDTGWVNQKWFFLFEYTCQY